MVYSSVCRTREEGIKYIEYTLRYIKVPRAKAALASKNARHAIWHIMNSFDREDETYTITIRRNVFGTNINIEAEGSKIIFDEDEVTGDDNGPDNIFFRSRVHESLMYKRAGRTNRISFAVSEAETKELAEALIAMVLGIVMGLVVRELLPENAAHILNYYAFDLFTTVFMNALKIIVGPVVFFSIVCCVAKMNNLRALGRIAFKTMLLYLCTTIVAIAIGFGLYQAFPVGDTSIASYVEENKEETAEDEEYVEAVENAEEADFSIRSLIAGIVPDNFVNAFLEVNLLQVIFLALFTGIGISRCGDHTEFLTKLCESFNRLFTTLTGIITKFIPLAVFCAMAQLVINVGIEAFRSILSFAVLVIAGMLLMIVFYGIFIFLTTRLNPVTFYKKFFKAMSTAFATSSATATMPTSIQCCRDMGIDDTIAGFTIPLGANINMDGSSMVFIMIVLFMSRIYGITFSGTMLVSIIISIILLALGSPTVAGADLVIIAVLLNHIGVPMESIGLILGVDAVFDMVQSMSNCTGDAVVSLIVAKSEKHLDLEKYNAQ